MQIRYVNTASTAGGDGTTNNTSGATRAYATLNAALTALPGTLTEAYTIYCDGSGGADTTACFQTPFASVTSAANYILITTQGSQRNTTGVFDTGKYYMNITNNNALYNNIPAHLRVDAIQIQLTVNDAGGYIAIKTSNANITDTTSDCRVSNCIVKGVQTSGTITAYHWRPITGGAGPVAYFWNNVCYGVNQGYEGDANFGILLNCGCYDSNFGFVDDGTTRARNCIAYNCTGGGMIGLFNNSSNNNATSDATAKGTSSRVSQTFTFVNAAGNNYMLTSGDAGARTFGQTDPSGIALFNNDIRGQTRAVPWDIGPFQVGVQSSSSAYGNPARWRRIGRTLGR